MRTIELAPGVVQLALTPFAGVNAYLLGDVLVDAGSRHHAQGILRAVAGRGVRAHALTHVHADHQGSTAAVCAALDIPLWVGAGEVTAMEAGTSAGLADGPSLAARIVQRVAAGPGRPVNRALTEGDEVGGFTVLQTPGHSPDHLAYWREEDRVLIAGDALRNLSYATLRPRLDLPYHGFNADQDAVGRSARRLIELEPAVVAFGHGPPIDGDAFARAAYGLTVMKNVATRTSALAR